MDGILDLDLEAGSEPCSSLDRYAVEQEVASCEKDTTVRNSSPCELLLMGEWIAMAMAEGLHPAVLELIESMDDPDKPGFPALVRS